jgi:hypothetical protein
MTQISLNEYTAVSHSPKLHHYLREISCFIEANIFILPNNNISIILFPDFDCTPQIPDRTKKARS